MADIGKMLGATGEVGTFLGVPQAEPGEVSAKVAILGAPCVTPYASVGPYCAGGPAAIRAASAAYAPSRGHVNFDLGRVGFAEGAVVDCGDIPGDPADPAGNRARLADAVSAILECGAIPLVIGGDDSGPIPVFDAYAGRGHYRVLQIDAHIDWRDEVGGERLGLSSPMRRASEMAHVTGMVQAGSRGMGSARAEDMAAARDWGAHLVGAETLAREGPGAVLAHLPEGAEILLAFDWDALDPAIMPAVIGRTSGGLGYWDAVELIAGAAARGRIAGACLMEFMPERDIDGLGAMLAAQMVATLCGILAAQG